MVRQRNRTFLPRLGESNIGQKKKLAQPLLMFVEGCNWEFDVGTQTITSKTQLDDQIDEAKATVHLGR